MQTVQTYPNLMEAQIAQGLLKSNGIDAFILEEDDSTSGIASIYGAVHLRVRKEDFADAKKVLDEKGPFSGDKSGQVVE